MVTYGAPTLQQFWASYNGKYGTNYSGEEFLGNHSGYSDSLYFPHKDYWNDILGYWLASVASVDIRLNFVNAFASVGQASNSYTGGGVRPLVRLPASAKAKWNGTSWDLAQ